MANNMISSLKIHKRRPMKKKKPLFKKIADYLKSDTYLFAPLVSSVKGISNTTSGVEGENVCEENEKNLLKKVGDYLRSDVYMYAPLVVPQPRVYSGANEVSPDPHTGPVQYPKKCTTPFSVEKVTDKAEQLAKRAAEGNGEGGHLEGHRARKSVIRKTVVRKSALRETVKHMVHQNCRSTSVPACVSRTSKCEVNVVTDVPWTDQTTEIPKQDTTDILSSWTGRDFRGGGCEGVPCNQATGRVTGLQLQRPSDRDGGLYMKGTMSPSLGSLHFLEVMVISGMKRIETVIPQSFSNLTRLTQLILEDNVLVGNIHESSFGQLPLLRTVSTCGNQLIGQIPPSLGSLKTLLQLTLTRNSFVGPTQFPKTFLSLQYIDLSYNVLSGLIPQFVGQLHNLTFLDLSNNQLSGQIPSSLCNVATLSDMYSRLEGHLKSLTSLSLSSNQLIG
ncbi:hypothetical protein RJ639_006808 [Escallonia herrerae]|uniref:Uncharacterized protein n=1 Tax=Escallonia herrerae TaxID=1293975 RepID=A0AA88VVP8_9ASTE|nr:hypothetical protein RJ639_006808 [Escallonia herrerae]